jgi:hypothetical protein
MARLAIRVAALFLTFALGVALAYVSHRCYIQFESTAVGSITMEPDGLGGFTAFRSYDGVHLTFAHARFSSREAAAEGLRRSLRGAVRVVERGPLYDREGENVVGERVVAIFPPNGYAQSEWASVNCLDGEQLYQISSLSLRHALAFDKTYRRY